MNVKDIKTIGMYGAGTIGGGFAAYFALKGLNVNVYVRSEASKERAIPHIQGPIDSYVELGIVDDGQKIWEKIKITTDPAIVGIGECLYRGTLISMFLVMFILPQILYLGDQIVERTRFNIKVPEVTRSISGTVYVNGRVRGRVSGVVDAHIHGVIQGDVSGLVETGSYQTEEVRRADETNGL